MEKSRMKSIDIVMPSIRDDVRSLLRAIPLDVPDGVDVSYYIISDRPGLRSETLEYNGCPVHFVVNRDLLGASLSRNMGIEMGVGDYVLFLDDDVEAPRNLLSAYMRAVENDADAAGYVGPTLFPEPINSFTRGIRASSMTAMFEIPMTREWVSWGTTSNIMIARKKIGDVRFLSVFPNNGGGEDIDFCLRVQAGGEKWFRTVPEAAVSHGWWSRGRRSYKRFFRWSFGDSRLPGLHRGRRFYDAPNAVEVAVFALPILSALSAAGLMPPVTVAAWLACAVTSEIVAEQVRVRLVSGSFLPIPSAESIVIRTVNDAGRLAGTLCSGSLRSLFSRFDFIGTGEWVGFCRKMGWARFGAMLAPLPFLLTGV